MVSMMWKHIKRVSNKVFVKKNFLSIYLSLYFIKLSIQLIYSQHRAFGTSLGFFVMLILGILSIRNFRFATIILSILILSSSIFNVIAMLHLSKHGVTTSMLGYTMGPSSLLVLSIIMNTYFLIGAIHLWRH